MRRTAKSILFVILYYSGLEWLLAKVVRPRAAAVLMYHGVCDSNSIPPKINFHVPTGVFERQMKLLRKRYRVVHLSELISAMERGEPIEKSVAITFDDGYRNNATNAAPILERLKLPYTVFVATAYIDTDRWIPLNEVYWNWADGKLSEPEMTSLRAKVRSQRVGTAEAVLPAHNTSSVSRTAEESFAMLNWRQIQEMAKNGAEFGSHTHSHCNMAVQSDDEQRKELMVSKELLERHLGSAVDLFAYPYGRREQMSETARQNIIRTGYRCAISAEYGLLTNSSDRYEVHRLGYDSRIWVFAGEIVYRFAKHAIKEALSRGR